MGIYLSTSPSVIWFLFLHISQAPAEQPSPNFFSSLAILLVVLFIMGPRHCDAPCFVAPSPDILLKIQAQAGELHGQQAIVGQKHKPWVSHYGRPKVPGLNDGTIFSQVVPRISAMLVL